MEELMDDEQELIDYMGPCIQAMIHNLMYFMESILNINWENLEARIIIDPYKGDVIHIIMEPDHSITRSVTKAAPRPKNIKLAVTELINRLIKIKPVRIERIDDYSFHIKGLNRKD